ncbi:MAG: HDOD domain-containing protein [Candidatus Zixiibacteriota bacterium]|nr:MAG: HDOD domain-containing protein [candidate division Zixibacteria bacterium]
MQTVETIKGSDVREQIAQNSDLLALPDAVIQILETVSNDEVSFETLSEIISRDPALTGRLLKIANSSFYGLSHRVHSIHQAVMVMGVTAVKCLALSAALFNPSRLPSDFEIDLNALYGNFVAIATTCRKLAVACNFRAPEDAFTCGLLLDIGLLYFLDHYAGQYRTVIRNARQSHTLAEAEKSVFGITHQEAGQLIAQKWGLPEHIISAIANHHIYGQQKPRMLDDIARLAVVLNRDTILDEQQRLEEKITKIGFVARRLNISDQQLVDISSTIMKDTIAFAGAIGIDIEDYQTILARANKEIFNTYLSLQKLFQERQELTNRLLNEEHERGILEAKQIATSTLSHYINNAAMEVSGHSQIIRLALKGKNNDEIVAMLPRELDVLDNAIQKITAVMEEISELNLLDEVQFFEKSKILNIDEKIKERIVKLSQPPRQDEYLKN